MHNRAHVIIHIVPFGRNTSNLASNASIIDGVAYQNFVGRPTMNRCIDCTLGRPHFELCEVTSTIRDLTDNRLESINPKLRLIGFGLCFAANADRQIHWVNRIMDKSDWEGRYSSRRGSFDGNRF